VRYLPDQKNNKISAVSKTVAILRGWRPLSGSNEMLPRANEIRFLIMSLRGLRKWLNQQVSKVIWQKAASPTCHPSRLRMHSSHRDPGPKNGSLDLHESAPKRHLDRFARFCTAHPCAQHTDTQTTLRATSVAIGRSRRCGLIIEGERDIERIAICTACRKLTTVRKSTLLNTV